MAWGVMHLVTGLVARLKRSDDERGAVATEYGLLLVLIALVIIVALTAFGLVLAGFFQQGANSIP